MEKSSTVHRATALYTPTQISEMLGVTESYVKHLLREGILKGSKLGKFWRVTGESFDAFIVGFDQDSHGKTGVSDDTKNRIRYHAGLKIKDTAPGSIEKLRDNIERLKAEIQTQDRFGKIPKIAKLQSTVKLRENKRQKIKDMPDILDGLADTAYPGVKDLVNETPDALEAKFTKEAQGSEDDQVQDEDDPPGETGFSVETVIINPDEKPWRTMKADPDS